VDASGASASPIRTSHVPLLNPYLPPLGSGRATPVYGLDPSPLVPDRGKGLCFESDLFGLACLDPRFFPPSRALPINPTFPLSSPIRFLGPFPSYPYSPPTFSDRPTTAFPLGLFMFSLTHLLSLILPQPKPYLLPLLFILLSLSPNTNHPGLSPPWLALTHVLQRLRLAQFVV